MKYRPMEHNRHSLTTVYMGHCMGEVLDFRAVRGIAPPGPVRLVACRDDFYLFVDENKNVRTFEGTSLNNRTFPPADKSMRGFPSALDFSPSHHMAAVGYSEGGFELLSLEGDKARKTFTKVTATAASSLVFRDDASFLLGQETAVVCLKVSRTLGVMLNVRESEVYRFQTVVTSLILPPVFRFQAGGKPSFRCVAPKFSDCLGVCTLNSFLFGFLNQNQEFLVSFEEKGDRPSCAFSIQSSDELQIAVSIGRKVLVYTASADKPPQRISLIDVDIENVYILFVSSAIVISLNADLEGFLVSVTGHFKLPVRSQFRGEFTAGDDCFYVASEGCLRRATLQTFRDRMDRCRASGDFDSSLDLCKGALRNEAIASIGLPSNAGQRRLVIEETLRDVLGTETTRRLSDGTSSGSSVADWLIGVNRELGMEDWIVTQGIEIFESHGQLPVLLKQMIESDPDATTFAYTAQFGSKLLESPRDFNVRDFILKLPNKVVSEEAVLRYGVAAGDDLLLSEFYVNRLNDIGSGLTVLANCGRYDDVCSLLISRVADMESSIRWVFRVSDGEFRFAKQLVVQEESRSIELFTTIEKYVEVHKSPFSHEAFENLMIRVLWESKVRSDHPLWIYLEATILKQQIRVTGEALRCLLRKIFSVDIALVDRREDLLLFIISGDVSTEFKESLLPLCDTFGFKSAKRYIQEDSRKYDKAIQELLVDPKSDVIDFMTNILERHRESHVSIQEAVLKNSSVFVARDVKSFVTFVVNYFKSSLQSIIASISYDVFRNGFLHELLVCPGFESLSLSDDISLKYFGFLCEYFPSEARGYIERRDEAFHKFLPFSERFEVFDCCAVIFDKMNNIERVCEFLSKYIETELICHANVSGDIDIGLVSGFVLDFVSQFLRKRASQDDSVRFAETVLKSFALPLYALSVCQCGPDKCDAVVELLKSVSSVIVHSLSFAKYLELVVVEFQELPFGFTRTSLLSILNDYEYDLDQNLSMVMLYHEDEKNTHARYISSVIEGTKYAGQNCNTCGCGLFGVSCGVKLFGCGHIFHETKKCLPREVCPKCNSEERLDQDIQSPIRVIQPPRVRRDLTHFEFLLGRKTERTVSTQPMKHGSVSIRRKSTFPI
jgi:hypothetical protein